MIGIGREAVVVLDAATMNPQPDGRVTVTRRNGQVLSVQPDGTFEDRPPGSVGPFEVAIVDGNHLVYCPDGMTVYAIPFVQTIPNA
jgi:hypothetical protein